MNREKIILVGGGGHCKACIDVIESGERYEIAGIVDIKENLGKKISGYPVVAHDEELKDLVPVYKNFLVTVGQLTTPAVRKKLYEKLKSLGATLPVIISPTAVVSRHCSVGEGTIVMHHAVINGGSNIGINCIVNTKSLVEHDCQVGDHNHLATGSILNGNVVTGTSCFIGSRAVVIQGIKIRDYVVIGAGALVTKNPEEPGTYMGIPAKKKTI